MSEEFNKDLCEEKHINIEKAFGNIEKTFGRLFTKTNGINNRLNWFFIVSITTLLSVIASIAKDVILK